MGYFGIMRDESVGFEYGIGGSGARVFVGSVDLVDWVGRLAAGVNGGGFHLTGEADGEQRAGGRWDRRPSTHSWVAVYGGFSRALRRGLPVHQDVSFARLDTIAS